MGRENDLKLVLVLGFLGLHLRANSQWLPSPIAPRPLCGTQFSLANHACAMLPYVPGTPPSTPPPPSPAGPHSRHRHRHGHRHRSHRYGETPVEQDCCRWLIDLDSECVCDLLLHLPPFLSRPVHLYTVQVGNTCNMTYQCGSRIRI